ncbi:MAG: DUF3392 family protein [Phycisphaera sp.]|nr:DUF3392 family protein [Phycisphaera sp.]
MANLHDILRPVTDFASQHVDHIALAIIGTVLVLYGHELETLIKKHVKGYHFVVRTLIFIGICAFGFGLITVLLAEWLTALLTHVDPIYLLPFALATFIGLGILAERKRFI